MLVKFFIYKNTDNVVIKALPEMPDNEDFAVERGDIWHEQTKILGGVNWDVCVWESSQDGFELTDYQDNKYMYDPTTEKFSLNTDWSVE